MPDITITDSIQATANIEFNDASPLGLAKLSQLKFSNLPVVGDLKKPIDQCSFKQVELGPTLIAPALSLGAETKLKVQGAETGTLSIRSVGSKTLFEEDGFCPQIPIQSGECWIGLELGLALSATIGATFNGFGVAANGSSRVAAGTYVRLKSTPAGLPVLRDALKTALENYSAARTSAVIGAQKVGIAYTLDTAGSIKFSGSYSLPIAVNPLASAGLPFNYKISLDPDVTVRVGGEVALNGEFIVRSYRTSETELTLGVYKKKNTTLRATFQAGAGIRAEIGETDVVSAFLGAVFPTVDPIAAGLTPEQGETFKAALKDCIDSSLSVAVNASCAASTTDESAIVYSIDLAAGNQTDTLKAIESAFHGDWTLLAGLPNTKSLRNIWREMHESKHKIAVNLLGFYNAGAVTDYLKSCTILHDETGQVVLVDKAEAKRIAVAGLPHLADAEKLRSALAEGFLATVTYGAATTGNWKFKDFSVQQNYVNYKAHMQSRQLRAQLLLGRGLQLIPDEVWNGIPGEGASVDHVKTFISARYAATAVLRLFYSDPAGYTGYTRTQLERVGRDAKLALLDETGPRRDALQDDKIWNAMSGNGNISAFKTLPELRNFNDTDLGAIAADWYDITWWAEAMRAVAPRLSQVLQAVGSQNAPNRKALEDALARASAHASSAFGDGWGLLTMFQLSGGAAELEMDIGWNGKFEHYRRAVKAAVAQA